MKVILEDKREVNGGYILVVKDVLNNIINNIMKELKTNKK
jgi:hypothetical protein